jgi:predicted RNA-binding Zn-ribbon protein involved in translation (DUF1610 family)
MKIATHTDLSRSHQPPDTRSRPTASVLYKCPNCCELLALTRSHVDRRHTAAVTVERYQCPACDAAYVFTPSIHRWARLAFDDD